MFIQTSLGPLDLLSSQTKKVNLHGPQEKRHLQIFCQRNSVDAVDKSIEFRLSITAAYFIPCNHLVKIYCDCIVYNNQT